MLYYNTIGVPLRQILLQLMAAPAKQFKIGASIGILTDIAKIFSE